jgi:hypothetical protein
MEIEGLSVAILRQLKTFQPDGEVGWESQSSAVNQTATRPVRAPSQDADVARMILGTSRDLPLPPSRRLLPSIWRSILLSTPWLWDLDADAVKTWEANGALGSGWEWDWELLVRQLTETAKGDGAGHVLLYDQTMPSLPPGLRNRRRIWQLVGDMQAGYSTVEADSCR